MMFRKEFCTFNVLEIGPLRTCKDVIQNVMFFHFYRFEVHFCLQVLFQLLSLLRLLLSENSVHVCCSERRVVLLEFLEGFKYVNGWY